MTQYVKQVYKGFPYQYTIKKDHYWDASGIGSISEDTEVEVNLEEYDAWTQNIACDLVSGSDYPYVTISSYELPNYEIGVGGTYALALRGSDYTILNESSEEVTAPGILDFTPESYDEDFTCNLFVNGTDDYLGSQAESVEGYRWCGLINYMKISV